MTATMTATMTVTPSEVSALPDDSPQKRVTDVATESLSRLFGEMKTLGGRQFWADVFFLHGWRIQQNILTGHCRLLDPQDHRHRSGALETCVRRLEEVQNKRHLPPMSGRVVILIHGIGRSSKCFSAMGKALQQDDCLPVGFDYPSTRVSIPQSATFLRRLLNSMPQVETVDVVCHSMGGLVLRSLWADHGEPRLHRVVMLGVPNKGAEMANFLRKNPVFRMLLGPAGQQLVTDAEGLIGRLPSPNVEFGIIAGGRGTDRGYNPLLPGDNDMTVTVESTRLNGAADFLRLPVIHSFLMTDPAAIEATRRFLRTGRFAGTAS
ncbi:MAG: hypothetical protein KDA89_08885 [Planctomycetaceae bacterium]|nr:hypothetical protein [Planctomycetaceae bacterium]